MAKKYLLMNGAPDDMGFDASQWNSFDSGAAYHGASAVYDHVADEILGIYQRPYFPLETATNIALNAGLLFVTAEEAGSGFSGPELFLCEPRLNTDVLSLSDWQTAFLNSAANTVPLGIPGGGMVINVGSGFAAYFVAEKIHLIQFTGLNDVSVVNTLTMEVPPAVGGTIVPTDNSSPIVMVDHDTSVAAISVRLSGGSQNRGSFFADFAAQTVEWNEAITINTTGTLHSTTRIADSAGTSAGNGLGFSGSFDYGQSFDTFTYDEIVVSSTADISFTNQGFSNIDVSSKLKSAMPTLLGDTWNDPWTNPTWFTSVLFTEATGQVGPPEPERFWTTFRNSFEVI